MKKYITGSLCIVGFYLSCYLDKVVSSELWWKSPTLTLLLFFTVFTLLYTVRQIVEDLVDEGY